MRQMLKRVAARLPSRAQNELKRLQFRREIRSGRFFTDEREYAMLERWVSDGDWVLDVGANIGHYTARLSSLVGSRGRVLAFEPVPATFELLAANVACLPLRNVTLLNVAASDETGTVGMDIPKFDSGLDNYYMAHLTNDEGGLQVLTLPVDQIGIPGKVTFVKIDAEGHDLQVIRGMKKLIEKDRPVIVTEGNEAGIGEFLGELDYSGQRLQGSSNEIFEPAVAAAAG